MLRAPLPHRRDLDGLRALAIVPVLLYHFGVRAVSGGFVGVDVFFVISGFLITALLLRDIEARTFSVVEFYERRARRILPALCCVLAVTTALALLLFLPIDLVAYGRSLTSTTLFSSNLLFWRQAGYFDRSADLKPLLHTWSLSVEEQFYILFPPFLWLLARAAKRHLATVLAAFMFLSFALCVAGATYWPVAAFYLPVTRAWELLIGALLATGAIRPVSSAQARHALSISGVALIAGSVMLVDRGMSFPGWLAAIPCLGAALVIHISISGGGLGNRMLQWRPLVGIGLISYSLYLWHWPLLVMARYGANRALTPAELAAVLAAVFGLSVISWRYVERPLRGRHNAFTRRHVFQFAAIASVTTIIVGGSFVLGAGLPSRLPVRVSRYADIAGERLDLSLGCFNLTAEDVRRNRLCTVGAAGDAPSFVVWGDSHAWRMATPLSEAAATADRTGLLASVPGCPPLDDVEWPSSPHCESFNQEVRRLARRPEIRTVILVGKWADYAEGVTFTHRLDSSPGNVLRDRLSGARVNVADNPRVFARALRRTVENLERSGRHVVVIGPVPEIDRPVPEALAKAERFGGTRDIGPSLAEFRDRQQHVLDVLAELATLPGVDVIYPSSVSCQSRCDVERRGQLLYVDDNHLSRAGLNLVKPLLHAVFDPPAFSSSRASLE